MSDDAAPVIVPARRGLSVKYRGRALVSLVDPEGRAAKLAAALLPAQTRTLYLCPSPLLGYGLENLNVAMPEDSAILLIEHDAALFDFTKNNLSSEKGRCVFVPDVNALRRHVREHWGPRFFRRVVEVNLTGGRDLQADFYDKCAAALRSDIALDWGNAMTLSRLGRLYIRNFFRNLPLLEKAPRLVPGAWGERPVLVAGAGPSLDAFFAGPESAAAVRGGGAAIIAVDTALYGLMQRGIRPDLVVVLESQHWNLGDFCGTGSEGLPVAMDMSALPAQARFAEAGLPSFFWTPWTALKLWNRLGNDGILPPAMPALGSVGLSAVELALRLSLGPVLTAGLDFAYTIDNYHARGAPSHRAALRLSGRFGGLYPLKALFRHGSGPAAAGTDLRTDPALRRYAELFRTEFTGGSGTGRIFDGTGRGLSLGVPVLNDKSAARILRQGGGSKTGTAEVPTKTVPSGTTRKFIRSELDMLCELRDALSTTGGTRTEFLIDELDYLWAHFPDCAAQEGRHPPVSDTAFLKRVRTELDPFISLLTKAESAANAFPATKT